MKKIQAVVECRVLVSHIESTSLNAAKSQLDDARQNKRKVLDSALTIEHQIKDLIPITFFGRQHPKKAAFESVISRSDSCSFSAKRKLTRHVIENDQLLE